MIRRFLDLQTDASVARVVRAWRSTGRTGLGQNYKGTRENQKLHLLVVLQN